MDEIHLTVCTLHGDKKAMEAQGNERMQKLKERIAEWQKTAVDNVIVTRKGRFLDEDLTLEAEGVRDGANLIVTVKGKRFQESAKSTPAKDSPLLAHSKSILHPPATASPLVPRGLGPAVQQPEVPKPPGPNDPVPPQVSDVDLAKLVEMGYSYEAARSALQKANGNVDAAVEILSRGSTHWIEYAKAEIRADPSRLNFYIERILQSPEIREWERESPGRLRKVLTADSDTTSWAANPTGDALVSGLAEMGFTEEQVRKALIDTNGDGQKALDILLQQ